MRTMTTVAPALSSAEALTSLSTSKKSIPRLRRPYSAERDPASLVPNWVSGDRIKSINYTKSAPNFVQQEVYVPQIPLPLARWWQQQANTPKIHPPNICLFLLHAIRLKSWANHLGNLIGRCQHTWKWSDMVFSIVQSVGRFFTAKVNSKSMVILQQPLNPLLRRRIARWRRRGWRPGRRRRRGNRRRWRHFGRPVDSNLK